METKQKWIAGPAGQNSGRTWVGKVPSTRLGSRAKDVLGISWKKMHPMHPIHPMYRIPFSEDMDYSTAWVTEAGTSLLWWQPSFWLLFTYLCRPLSWLWFRTSPQIVIPIWKKNTQFSMRCTENHQQCLPQLFFKKTFAHQLWNDTTKCIQAIQINRGHPVQSLNLPSETTRSLLKIGCQASSQCRSRLNRSDLCFVFGQIFVRHKVLLFLSVFF